MIDFTDCKEVFNNYNGSEKKKTLLYDGKRYLVKFPDPVREKNKNISYINNAFSEYVGSNIFKLVGFKVQNTILGNYFYNGKNKIVCACEDFTDDHHILYEFENLALSTNPDKKIETEIDDIMEVISNISDDVDIENIKNLFWDMFIIDSIIGNTDRHNGNWGFILDKNSNKISFSPIYDCGSCLSPLLDDDEIKKISEVDIKNLSLNCYSCITIDNKKINYMSYISSMCNSDVNDSIKRVYNNININDINNFIDNIECISSVRKNFYKELINRRYEIIKGVYEKLTD